MLMQASSARSWSAQQQAIFDWFAEGSGNLVVRARAGTGKTTTIIEALKHANESRILLAAFNKRIADELQQSISTAAAQAMTLHGVGYRCVLRYWERIRLDADNRATDLAKAVCGAKAPDAVVRLVSKLHTKGREMLPHAQAGDDLFELAEMFDLVPDPEWQRVGWTVDRITDLAYQAMDLAANERPSQGIDFADMLFLPVRNGWLTPSFDLVVVDEAQDMNATQLEIARGVLVEGGRMCVVGDDRQAIYGFRGADTGSIDRLKAELDAEELGLTTTYRCGKVIVDAARRLVPDYQSAPDAHAGRVVTIPFEQLMTLAGPGDYILSRVNAPLVSIALAMIRAGRRVRIEGRDIGKGLKVITQQLTKRSGNSVPEWLKALGVWQQKQIDRAEKAGLFGKVDMILDQGITLRALADGVAGVREIEARIDLLFSMGSNEGFTICSSIHKAKGLEADRVFVLQDTLYPPVACACGHRHPWGGGACQRCSCRTYQPHGQKLTEEQNIEYVAITRAKQELVWVEGRGVE